MKTGDDSSPVKIRVATFNASLNRNVAGQLRAELTTGDCPQARNVAEIIQRTAPNILVLQEFDYDESGVSLTAFRDRFLGVSQSGAKALKYPYAYVPEMNTGLGTGLDLDRDGRTDGPGDAQGFGKHPGQYGFVVLSQFPLLTEQARTFQTLLWQAMPNALIPKDPATSSGLWYTPEMLAKLRLSSKNHIDLPVKVGHQVIHLLVAHPTPPVFDGPEDRNGRRNHDEIRVFADYLDTKAATYLVDDAGHAGGLSEEQSFIILGDMNADPVDGDSTNFAIKQLLDHPRVNERVARGDMRPKSAGGAKNAKRADDKGAPAFDTAAWGLRVDYVLPSKDLKVSASGVFWPTTDEPLARLVGFDGETAASSDHRLVWIDISVD